MQTISRPMCDTVKYVLKRIIKNRKIENNQSLSEHTIAGRVTDRQAASHRRRLQHIRSFEFDHDLQKHRICTWASAESAGWSAAVLAAAAAAVVVTAYSISNLIQFFEIRNFANFQCVGVIACFQRSLQTIII